MLYYTEIEAYIGKRVMEQYLEWLENEPSKVHFIKWIRWKKNGPTVKRVKKMLLKQKGE